ncbi:MAG: hypothetical protein M3O71_23060 [Bacteroidota bacterium]|nr:hypothetical protein [Bacteroidota bacterium]
MKISFKATAIIACIVFTGLWSCAQVPPAGTPPPPQAPVNRAALIPPPPLGPGQPQPAPAGPQANRGLQQLTAINGKVAGYLTNDRYEYDGLTLQNGSTSVTVRFPAHLGAELMKAAQKGSTLTVNGFYESSSLGTNEFHLVNAKAGGTVITNLPAVLTATPQAEEQKSFSGAITDLRRSRDGVLNGVVLDKNQVIELPPPAAEQLQGLLKSGEQISGTGIKITPQAGVVMAQNLQQVRPQTLTVNGQTYLVR